MKEVFGGVKIADFTWAMTGPLITKYFADHGATVVRVESTRRPCVLRTTLPYPNNMPHADGSGYFAFVNANKYSIAINMDTSYGQEVAKKLVAWADIVVENFRPGVIDKFGLDYEGVKSINPNVIMLRSSSQGQFGRYAHHGTLGQPLTALSGFYHLTGWPDGEPMPLPVAYSDWVASRFGASVVIAALDYRRRTGTGQCIDVSQLEASLQFMIPPVLDYIVNGVVENRNGNAVPYAAPHGVYRCKGDDRWCAIAVFTDEEWRSFCKAVGHLEWAGDSRFFTLGKRKGNEETLNKLVEAWTISHAAEEVMDVLQGAGVCAGVVQNAEDLYGDKQLQSRDHLWKAKHNFIGTFSHLGQPYKLSETPARPRFPAPCLGEHTEYVCTNILNLSTKKFIELDEKGAFT